jgi:hypothetical protein
MPMRRFARMVRLGPALVLAVLVAGCTNTGLFDPTEFFSQDMFDTKKKLQGERKLVFPEGVPGTRTGVPPELVKGNQPPEPQALQADAAAAAGQPADAAAPPAATAATAAAQGEPLAAEPDQPKPKPKPKKKVVRAPPPAPDDSVWEQKPAPTRIEIRRPSPAPTTQPAEPQAAQTAQPAQSSQSVWPDPPPVNKPAPNVWPDPRPPSQFPR